MRRIAILGGSGFVGRHLSQRLTAMGHHCTVITRHAHRSRELLTHARVVEANPYDADSLRNALAGCDTAVNLVGILNATRRESFRRVHVELVDGLLAACHAEGVGRLLHMSALHADQGAGASQYLRTRGEGENRAHTLGRPGMDVTSFRPSVIFGPDDSFLNRFAAVVRIPGPLPLARAHTRFAPVFVGDVVEAFARALEDRSTFGQHYELCGPESYTLAEIIRFVAAQLGVCKPVIALPDWAGRLQAQALQYVPGKPFTPDNFDSMRVDSVCSNDGLARLGIQRSAFKPLAERYLRGIDRNSERIHRRRSSGR